MRCEDFRIQSLQFDDGVVPKEMSDWEHHVNKCQQCSDWADARQVTKRGFDPSKFPCVHLANFATMTCDQHPDPLNCPDILIYYNPRHDEYALPVRDGGPSYVPIRYCPWCGAPTPESKRDRWFEELAAIGVNDPYAQDIPAHFKTDEWWKRGVTKP